MIKEELKLDFHVNTIGRYQEISLISMYHYNILTIQQEPGVRDQRGHILNILRDRVSPSSNLVYGDEMSACL